MTQGLCPQAPTGEAEAWESVWAQAASLGAWANGWYVGRRREKVKTEDAPSRR